MTDLTLITDRTQTVSVTTRQPTRYLWDPAHAEWMPCITEQERHHAAVHGIVTNYDDYGYLGR